MKKNKTALITGIFNVLHPGHIDLFRFASKHADKVIVGVIADKNSDKKSIISEKYRLQAVSSNSYVSESFIFYKSIENLIKKIKPDYIVKGKEFISKENIEKKIIKSYGGKIIFSTRSSIFSGSDLIKKEIINEKINFIQPIEYLKRHKIKISELTKLVSSFSKLSVCVFGDLILDEYIATEALGMSQEDPTIVVSPIKKDRFIGGSGIVACHAASLKAKVNYFSVSGDDEQRKFCIEKLNKYKIKSFIPIDKSRPTIFKQRYRVKNKTMFKVSTLQNHKVSINIINRIKRKFLETVKNNKIDLVIFSDFNYGFVTKGLIDYISTISKKYNIKVIADCQTSSQYGNILKYNDINLITPTEQESRVSLHDYECGLVELIHKMQKKSLYKNVFLKLGKDGFLIQNNDKNSLHTDKLGPINLNPKDASGAGDSLLTFSGLALASNTSIWVAAYLGALAAAIQVSRIGNIPISKKEILMSLK